jgi:hypothetical protein
MHNSQHLRSRSVGLKSVSKPSQLSTSSDDPDYQPGSSGTGRSSAMDRVTDSDFITSVSLFCHNLITFVMYCNKLRD